MNAEINLDELFRIAYQIKKEQEDMTCPFCSERLGPSEGTSLMIDMETRTRLIVHTACAENPIIR